MNTDLSSPKKTLQILEHAYRAKDLALARTCLNFEQAARLMLHHFEKGREGVMLATQSTVAELAETLELKWQQAELPSFDGVITHVTSVECYFEQFHVVTEVGRLKDGTKFHQRLFMSCCAVEWAYLCPATIYEKEPKAPRRWWQRRR